MTYLSWSQTTITDFSDKNINFLYNRGYVFTRIGKGAMTQTRSVRINLVEFKVSSENRRVLKKTENINLKITNLPHPNYDWRIHKLGVDFYTSKFGKGTFSANKIKELLTGKESNFNLLLVYEPSPSVPLPWGEGSHIAVSPSPHGRGARGEGSSPVGYCIARETNKLLHYGYPFYNTQYPISNIGMAMMTKAIIWAKEQNKKYVYLGSAQNPAAIYKLQFSGLEWFDGKNWQTDTDKLKKVLNSKGGSGAATV